MKNFKFDSERTEQLDIPEIMVVAGEGDDKTFGVLGIPSCERADKCPKCHKHGIQQRGYKIRTIKDCIISFQGVKHITLRYYQRQFACTDQHCKHVFPEYISCFGRKQTATNRLKQYTYTMVTAWNSYGNIAKEVGVSFDTISRWKSTVREWLRIKEFVCHPPNNVAISKIIIDRYQYTAVANVDAGSLIAFWPGNTESLLKKQKIESDVGMKTMRDNAIECIRRAKILIIDPYSDYYDQMRKINGSAKICINPRQLRNKMDAAFAETVKTNLPVNKAERFCKLVINGNFQAQGDCNFINRVLSAHPDLKAAYEIKKAFELSCWGGEEVEAPKMKMLVNYMGANGFTPNTSRSITDKDIIEMCFGMGLDFPALDNYYCNLQYCVEQMNLLVEKAKGKKGDSLVEDVVDCMFFSNPRFFYVRDFSGYKTVWRETSISPFDIFPKEDRYSYDYLGRRLYDIMLNLDYKIDLSNGTSCEGEWLPGTRHYEGPVICCD